MLMIEGLLMAAGFTGALTLVWLVRRGVLLFTTGPGTSAYFGPEADEAPAREIGKARREVLVLGSPGPRMTRALTEARGRKVALDVLLDPDADDTPFADNGLQPRPASRSTPEGTLVIVDDRAVIFATAGQTVIASGYNELVSACRQQFAAYHPVGQVNSPPTSQPAPKAPTPASTVVQRPATPPAPVMQPMPTYTSPVPPPASAPPAPAPTYHAPAPSPVDELLAAVARGTTYQQPADEYEEEEEENAPPVTRATAELFARLRREAAGQSDSDEKVA